MGRYDHYTACRDTKKGVGDGAESLGMHQSRAVDNSQVVMKYCRPSCHPLALLLYGSVHFAHNSIYINKEINNIYRVLS